jgi:FkbM family methyltransferase
MSSLRSTALTSFKNVFGEVNYERVSAILKYTTSSYSQFGEDVHIYSFYARLAHDLDIHVHNGWIVDVGAFRPIIYSNTYLFYKRGWRCINIDPTPGMKSHFDSSRPSDVNIEMAIASKDGDGQFFIFGTPSVWNTFDAEAAARAQQTTRITPKVIQVQRRRLETILRDNLLEPERFEILTIDAECYDLEVLESNNFRLYRPRIILIEVQKLDLKTIESSAVTQFLHSQGYVLFSWINPNLMFVRNDSICN